MPFNKIFLDKVSTLPEHLNRVQNNIETAVTQIDSEIQDLREVIENQKILISEMEEELRQLRT